MCYSFIGYRNREQITQLQRWIFGYILTRPRNYVLEESRYLLNFKEHERRHGQIVVSHWPMFNFYDVICSSGPLLGFY